MCSFDRKGGFSSETRRTRANAAAIRRYNVYIQKQKTENPPTSRFGSYGRTATAARQRQPRSSCDRIAPGSRRGDRQPRKHAAGHQRKPQPTPHQTQPTPRCRDADTRQPASRAALCPLVQDLARVVASDKGPACRRRRRSPAAPTPSAVAVALDSWRMEARHASRVQQASDESPGRRRDAWKPGATATGFSRRAAVRLSLRTPCETPARTHHPAHLLASAEGFKPSDTWTPGRTRNATQRARLLRSPAQQRATHINASRSTQRAHAHSLTLNSPRVAPTAGVRHGRWRVWGHGDRRQGMGASEILGGPHFESGPKSPNPDQIKRK